MRARAILITAVTAVFAMAGCRDSGLPDRNLALEDAAHRAPDALVQAVYPQYGAARSASDAAAHGDASMASRPITVGEQTFQASGRPVRLSGTALTAVGAGPMGGTFSAATWDEPPYDRLYLAHPGGTYVEYLPVHGGDDPTARLEAGRHTLEGGTPAAH